MGVEYHRASEEQVRKIDDRSTVVDVATNPSSGVQWKLVLIACKPLSALSNTSVQRLWLLRSRTSNVMLRLSIHLMKYDKLRVHMNVYLGPC